MVDNVARKLYENPMNIPITEEKELNWSSVSLSDVIVKGNRLEASSFDVDVKKAHELIKRNKFKLVTLGGKDGLLEYVYHRPRFKRIWTNPKEGVAIYQPSSISDISPQTSTYISLNTDTDIEKLKVSKNQILVSCSGTVGNITIVTNTLENKIFSHDLLRLKANNEVDTGYIYAYLKTDIGQKILKSNGYGSVITHIEPEHMQEVFIPNAPLSKKRSIHEKVMKSYDLRDESNDLINEATQSLIKELQLPDISEFESNNVVDTFSTKLSSLNQRLDSSYHLESVGRIENHLNKYAKKLINIGHKTISEKIILPGRFKRTYVNKGQGNVFFGGAQLYQLNPTNKKYLSFKHHAKRLEEQLLLKENMVMITCSGTIGKVALVPRHWNNWAANQHIIRIVCSQQLAGFLYIFLQTDYGECLIKRHTYGSVVDEITDIHVSDIKIPILINEVAQTKINNLALQANELRYEAYKLEQSAIEEMNEIIFN